MSILDSPYAATDIRIIGKVYDNKYGCGFEIKTYGQIFVSGTFENNINMDDDQQQQEYGKAGALFVDFVYPIIEFDISPVSVFLNLSGANIINTTARTAVRVKFAQEYLVTNEIDALKFIQNIDEAIFEHNGNKDFYHHSCNNLYVTDQTYSEQEIVLCNPGCELQCTFGCDPGNYTCYIDSDGDAVSDHQEYLDDTDPGRYCKFNPSSQLMNKNFLELTSDAYKSADCDSDGFSNYDEQCKLI